MATAEKQLAEARAAIGEASGAKADLASAMSEATASLDRAKAEALAGAEKAKAEAKAAGVAAKAEREAAAAALASASALEQKAEKRHRTLSSAWRQIGTQRAKVKAERAELEAWAGRGGRVGEFFGRLFSRASGVFSLRGMRERQLAAKLQAAERSAAGATARADEAEAKAKRRDWEKDALTQRHEKAVRAIDADRLKMGQELEALKKQPAGGIKPAPAKRLRS
jgi:DNA repair exonuclease SbcCD ATPase subunit